MLTRTYISKYNTIISNSKINTGINPVSELVYGGHYTRALIYFDHNKIKELVNDKTYSDISKLKHYLKITNAGSIDDKKLHSMTTSSISEKNKVRASSFDLIFFRNRTSCH